MTPLFIAQIVLTLFVFFMLLNSAAVMVYVERKVAALLQQRLGPYLVGPKGVLQPLADVIKLMFKEELRPKAADAFLFVEDGSTRLKLYRKGGQDRDRQRTDKSK